MSQKASDFSAIPLCSAHHRHDPDSYHQLGEERFACKHRLNLPELVLALNSQFRRQAASESPLQHAGNPDAVPVILIAVQYGGPMRTSSP